MSADSVFGRQLADRLGAWQAARSLSVDLAALYDAVHVTATEALVASVRNDAAYRSAAVTMIDVVSGLPKLDLEARELARQVGLATEPSVAP